MKFLVDLMYQAAMHGTVEDQLAIHVYGDKALGNGTCADPELVGELVLISRVRLQIYEHARIEWECSGRGLSSKRCCCAKNSSTAECQTNRVA